MPDKPAVDKAPFAEAAKTLFRGALAAALSAEADFPQMQLDEFTVDWAVAPRFAADQTPLADTDDPDSRAFTMHAEYKRDRTPKLEKP
jgi:hypothetical protein